ncbi:MAG TPA: aldo/keto reductase [Actinobacteria bacterium]|nr:aldo/keto reductase [Actinomycetota bacterium]
MTTRALGATGVHVSQLCLGAMMFGRWGEPDHDTCVSIIHKALDSGINFIDTADMYSFGESETIIGKALVGKRDDVVLATKFHNPMHRTDLLQRGNSRRWIIKEVEASLKRLQTDWIDLYQVHRPEPGTDFEETLRALDDLVHQGKIRYIGTSTYPATEIVEGQWLADRKNLNRVVAEQPPYSIFVRGIEKDVLPTAQKYGMGTLTWSPLASGWLSGRYKLEGSADSTSPGIRKSTGALDPSLPENRAKLVAADALGKLAAEAGLTLPQLAIAFVLEHPGVTSAIIGPRTMEQLVTQLGADELQLSQEVLDRIDEIVAPGTILDGMDSGWALPAMTPAGRRRSLA